MTDSTAAGGGNLSTNQRDLIAAARAAISRERLLERCRAIVDIPSPTGEELPLARHLARELEGMGAEATVQEMSDRQGNAVGRLRGTGDGAELLLYAPIDAAFSGNLEEDEPWLGREPRPDLALPARIEGGKVIGLAAENPKSYVACILETVEVLAGLGATLPGTITAGFGAGGMPTSGRPGLPAGIGHGAGCAHLLEHGVRPDVAIIVKPGYAVSWEEVGLSWHTVTVRGSLNYAGIRHRVPYRNPIVSAAAVIEALEAWFPVYTARHTDGLVSPQGSIGAIRAGGGALAAFVPPTCQLFLDVRVSPRSSPAEVSGELNSMLAELKTRLPDLDVESEMTVAIDGGATDPDSWIVQALVRAWEEREGRPHQPATGTSGATDAAILRGHGVPTARIGPPPAATPSPYPGFSMGVADGESMEALVSVLVHAVVDTATRRRADILDT
jgi:acetylornithine deacetylase/succinyl-diaminopimelate desuccinylase-like protein